MKRRATGLLVVASIVFVVARALEDRHGWLGYVRATAEAAMVGGLADWFAVTALFRHPLGLPIPHTAIIPTRKDDIGRGLGGFVQQNFLNPDAIAEKVRSIGVAARLGAWIREGENARTAAAAVAGFVRTALHVADDAEIHGLVERAVRSRVDRLEMAPLAGRALEWAREHGRHHEVVEGALAAVSGALADNRETLRAQFAVEAPKWLPGKVEDRVFERLYEGVQRFLAEVRSSRAHLVRQQLDARIVELAHRLQHEAALIERGEALKQELLAHPSAREWSSSLWADLKGSLLVQVDDAHSPLHERMAEAIRAFGTRLDADADLSARVDAGVERAARVAVTSQGHEFANVIAQTVERWDATEAANRIERQVGRDLQFIRINGTLVGGLAGLLIHTASRLWG